MSDEKRDVKAAGVRFNIEMFFVCPQNHMHPVSISFEAVDIPNFTSEAIAEARDNMLAGLMPDGRLATDDEINAFEKERGGLSPAEMDAREATQRANKKGEREYFMAPGSKEVQ